MNPNGYRFGRYYFNPTWAAQTASHSQPGVVYNSVVNFTVAPDGTHYFHQTFSGQFTLPETNMELPIPPSYPQLENKPRTSRRRKPKEGQATQTRTELEKKDNRGDSKHCDDGDKEGHGKTEEAWAPQDDWASDWEDTQSDDLDESTDYSLDEDDTEANQGGHNQGAHGEWHTQGRQNRDPRSSIVSMFPLPNMNLFGGPPGP